MNWFDKLWVHIGCFKSQPTLLNSFYILWNLYFYNFLIKQILVSHNFICLWLEYIWLLAKFYTYTTTVRRTNIASQPAIHECYVYKSRTWLVSKNLCFWRIHVSIIWVSHCWYHLNRQHTSHTCCFSKSLRSLFLLGRSWTHGAFLVRSMCVDSITSFLVDIISYAPMLRKLSRSLVISLLREPKER